MVWDSELVMESDLALAMVWDSASATEWDLVWRSELAKELDLVLVMASQSELPLASELAKK